MMMRRHMYHEQTLRTRAALAQARPLFKQTRLVKQATKLRFRLDRLRRKQPQRLTGRHMMTKDLLLLVAKKRKAGVYADKHIGKRIVRSASSTWKSAPESTNAAYAAAAVEEQVRQRAEIQEKVTAVAAALAVLRSREGADDAASGLVRMSSCAFSAAELADFDRIWRRDGRSHPQVRDHENWQRQLVGEPEASVKNELMKRTAPEQRCSSPRYPWLRVFCLQRQHFSGTLAKFKHGGAEQFGVFMSPCRGHTSWGSWRQHRRRPAQALAPVALGPLHLASKGTAMRSTFASATGSSPTSR